MHGCACFVCFMSSRVPLTVTLPTEPTVSSCLLLVAVVLFSQSPILASPAGWSRLAANAKTNKWASKHTLYITKTHTVRLQPLEHTLHTYGYFTHETHKAPSSKPELELISKKTCRIQYPKLWSRL